MNRGYIYEKDGATWFSSTSFGDDKDRVVVKQTGDYTYFASDIAYHKDKLDRGFDTIIDIWGADHHGYIPRLKSVLGAFGLPKEKFRVILIQMVALLRRGEAVQMSKRAGEFVTLREVVDEVGADITKFIFLTRRADSQLEFDIEVAKEQSAENPVFYVQYAFARISSIFRQAMEKGVSGQQSAVSSQDVGARRCLALLKEDEEISVIKKLLQYPMVFEGAAVSCEPHRITYYLQELAGMFHSYYNKHRVISDDMDTYERKTVPLQSSTDRAKRRVKYAWSQRSGKDVAMLDYVIALIIHVISIIIWIGGVSFVTMITFPMIQRGGSSLEQVMMFQGTEHRFGKIAKTMVILAGLSGLYLIKVKGMSFGVWVMIILWAVYASLLFGLEKMIFKKLFGKPSDQIDTKKIFCPASGISLDRADPQLPRGRSRHMGSALLNE